MGPRVRAILLEDGTGSVELAHAYNPEDREVQARHHAVKTFLEEIGSGDARYLIQLCVKYWFAHSLGQLVVFPADLACLAVHDLIQSAKRLSWKKSAESLAYFLPKGQVGSTRMSSAQKKRFGSAVGREVFLGGGPFVLEDAQDLVERAMRRIGYLDDACNADLEEAVFCFVNKSGNTQTLRKLRMLPGSGDTSQIVRETLRAAFLSRRGSGYWYSYVMGAGPPNWLHALPEEGRADQRYLNWKLLAGRLV